MRKIMGGKILILPRVLYGFETKYLTLKNETLHGRNIFSKENGTSDKWRHKQPALIEDDSVWVNGLFFRGLKGQTVNLFSTNRGFEYVKPI
jgi:hypothetical protein